MRFCIIGCGEHACSSHGPAIETCAASRPALELAACCDLDAAKAEQFASRFRFARAYTDVVTMLDAERPDAAALVVPVAVTCELGVRVLSRGIPLLIEKPPGETVEEVDRLAEAALAGGADARPVPHQVAFNRRYVPLIVSLRERLGRLPPEAALQHVRYEMVRVDRLDPDFSTTAVHAIDAVRFIAGSDFSEARFRYQPLPGLGDGVANIFMDGALRTGATAHLAFCPVAGAVVERAELHARHHTFFVEIPMWNGYDSPGRLIHLERGVLVEELRGSHDDRCRAVALGGFLGEYEAFFQCLATGCEPSPSLASTRQSVEVAQAMRARQAEWHS